MDILILLTFILVCYGFSNMVVYSTGPIGVFAWWREFTFKIHPNFGELFSCMICFPTWAGIFISAINLFIVNQFYFTPMNKLLEVSVYDYSGIHFYIIALVVLLLDGAIASGTSWVIHNIEEHFEK